VRDDAPQRGLRPTAWPLSERRVMSILEIELDRPIEQPQIDQLALFSAKYNKLRENWLALGGDGVKLTGWVGIDEEGKHSSTGSGIDIQRLKGLYVDFRHFILERDLVHFCKIRKVVLSYVHKPPAVRCLDSIKEHWQRSDSSTDFSLYSIEELMDLTFNADIFHVREKAMIERLESVRESVSDSLRTQLVVTAIFEKMHAVGNLVWVIEPLSVECQKIRVPERFA
jgi:hypothetical protein